MIAGIAVGALAAVVLCCLIMQECRDRRRRKEEQSVRGSSALDSATQQGDGYEDHPRGIDVHSAYNDTYGGGDRHDGQRLPPIPDPPQLPNRASGRPSGSKLAAVRRELQEQPDHEMHSPERAPEAGGPSLQDLGEQWYFVFFTYISSNDHDIMLNNIHSTI